MLCYIKVFTYLCSVIRNKKLNNKKLKDNETKQRERRYP